MSSYTFSWFFSPYLLVHVYPRRWDVVVIKKQGFIIVDFTHEVIRENTIYGLAEQGITQIWTELFYKIQL
ncbi:MAG: hypothetical protein ABFS35_22960 [Bacteroidota bacterium]